MAQMEFVYLILRSVHVQESRLSKCFCHYQLYTRSASMALRWSSVAGETNAQPMVNHNTWSVVVANAVKTTS